jgi:hypothetical protein
MKFPVGLYTLLFILIITACKKNTVVSNSITPPVSTLSISSISPATGPYGTKDTIIGTDFGNDTTKFTVKINGVKANVFSISGDTLIVIVPDNAGTGPVTITVNGQTVTGPNFNYVYTATVSTYAGNGLYSYATGPAADASFGYIFGMAVDAKGNLFFTDQGALIGKISTDQIVSTYAGTGVAGFLDGPAATAQFDGTSGIAIDNLGNLYIADQSNASIRKISTDGNVTTFMGKDPVTNSYIFAPEAIAIDSSGNLYSLAQGTNLVYKITPDGNATVFAGNGVAGYVDGNAANAEFSALQGIAVDRHTGNLYISDGNNVIRKITPAGVVSTFAGNGKAGLVNGPAATAEFNAPIGVTVDELGNVYVADDYYAVVRMITPDGMVSTLAGAAQLGYLDGPAAQALFYGPYAIVAVNHKTIYVSDIGNWVIRKISLH